MTLPSVNKNLAAQDNGALPPLAANGQKYVVGSTKGGVSMQLFSVTPVGATYTVVFADEGVDDMEDANYRIFIGGEDTTTSPRPDVSTKTTTGFDLINATAAEVIDVMIVGRVAGTRADAADL